MNLKRKLIFIIGMPGSGKTTTGKKLANKLTFNFVDLDRFIEAKEGLTISELFQKKGEAYFRAVEHNVLIDLLQHTTTNTVISTGGGTPYYFDAMKILLEKGICIYLKADIELVVSRIKQSKENRPLLNNENPKQKLIELLEERKEVYEKAHFHFEAKNPDIELIIDTLKPFL